ncbi:MAG: uncharacterized protein K0S35_3161 [Geminicoccaceae bacterium]|nr:uncharacterized protein [Geminicoccaceae bacterium]
MALIHHLQTLRVVKAGNGAASPALSALSRKCAELAGEAEHLARQLDRLRAELAHLDAAIRILCPEARPELIKPKVPGRRGCDWFGRGELGRMVLDTLREATAPCMDVYGRSPLCKGFSRRATADRCELLTCIRSRSAHGRWP